MLLGSDLWRERGFVKLWAANGISRLGTLLGFFANVNQLTLRQAITPERLLGRMNSVARLMYWGTMPIGSALGGVVAQSVDLRTTLYAAAAGGLAMSVPIFLSPIRRLHELPEPAREPESAALARTIGATVEADA